MSIKEAKEIIAKIEPQFKDEYQRNGLDFASVIMATIKRESDFTPDAINKEANKDDWRDDSSGYTQCRIDTARQVWRWWNIGFKTDKWIYDKLISDREFNILTGAKYLTWQLRRYKWDLAKAYAAYNAGSAIYSNGELINKYYSIFCMKWYDTFKKEKEA